MMLHVALSTTGKKKILIVFYYYKFSHTNVIDCFFLKLYICIKTNVVLLQFFL